MPTSCSRYTLLDNSLAPTTNSPLPSSQAPFAHHEPQNGGLRKNDPLTKHRFSPSNIMTLKAASMRQCHVSTTLSDLTLVVDGGRTSNTSGIHCLRNKLVDGIGQHMSQEPRKISNPQTCPLRSMRSEQNLGSICVSLAVNMKCVPVFSRSVTTTITTSRSAHP